MGKRIQSREYRMVATSEGFFARIAGDAQLQREMLQALSKYPQCENDLVAELARTLKFRRWLLKIAGRS